MAEVIKKWEMKINCDECWCDIKITEDDVDSADYSVKCPNCGRYIYLERNDLPPNLRGGGFDYL